MLTAGLLLEDWRKLGDTPRVGEVLPEVHGEARPGSGGEDWPPRRGEGESMTMAMGEFGPLEVSGPLLTHKERVNLRPCCSGLKQWARQMQSGGGGSAEVAW